MASGIIIMVEEETFGMRMTRLERRLNEIDEHEKNLDTK